MASEPRTGSEILALDSRARRQIPSRRRPWKFETRLLLWTLLSGAPALILAGYLLWRTELSSITYWISLFVLVSLWWGVAWVVRERVVRPLQTASNLLSALREEDFSIRARSPRRDDVLGELMREINALSQTLHDQRLGALEASALARTVMTEIDVAVFTFDDARRLEFVNRAGERLLSRPQEQLLGRTAAELHLDEFLEGDPARTLPQVFPQGPGRWEIRRSAFRREGRPHQLLVLTDLSRVLREEERQAWQRMVRVLGHELNNSLAPIKSIAGSLGTMLDKRPRPDDWEADVRTGLGIIAGRAASLSRFMEAYARLARLPAPRRQPVRVADWVRRGAELERRVKVEVVPGPDLILPGDGDQLEQLLINLVQNAVEATDSQGPVTLTWARRGSWLEVLVRDEGPGLSNSANLFVPFFTTKPNGSGIGLVLSRQIAEAHGGSLTLENRREGRGCEARLRVPLS